MEAADLRPGVLVKVPQGADPARAATAYLLPNVRSVEVWASGVAHLVGEVRRLGGRPSTRRGKFRTLTVHPRRLEAAAVKPADLPPAPFGIAWVLRDAGFTVSTELPQRALRRRCRPGSRLARRRCVVTPGCWNRPDHSGRQYQAWRARPGPYPGPRGMAETRR
jgi:hypothetical protein